MGDCKNIVAVFDKPWEEVLERLRENFEYMEKKDDGEDGNWLQFKDTSDFRLVSTGDVHFVMKTAEGFGIHDYFWANIFSRDTLTVIDFKTCTRGLISY